MPQAKPDFPWGRLSGTGDALEVGLPSTQERRYLVWAEEDFETQAAAILDRLAESPVSKIIYFNELPAAGECGDPLRIGLEKALLGAAIYEEKYGKPLARFWKYVNEAFSPGGWTAAAGAAVALEAELIERGTPLYFQVIGGAAIAIFSGSAALSGVEGFRNLKDAFSADEKAARDAVLAATYLDLAKEVGGQY